MTSTVGMSGMCVPSMASAAGTLELHHCTSSSSTSKMSVALPGMGPLPVEPYASDGGMMRRRNPPTFMPTTPVSQPSIT